MSYDEPRDEFCGIDEGDHPCSGPVELRPGIRLSNVLFAYCMRSWPSSCTWRTNASKSSSGARPRTVYSCGISGIVSENRQSAAAMKRPGS